MATRTINPDPAILTIEAIQPDADQITIVLRTCRPMVNCPDCGQASDRPHSWYRRTVTDLPWQGFAVRFRLHTRRWRCLNPDCGRHIFTERLPEVVAPFARRTARLAEVVDAIAFALGGEAGARILATLGLSVSADTLLNRIRSAVVPTVPAPRVIGIDDWAWRKGQRYGTVIVDLERHRVIDLLPDRTAETVRAWLQQHPSIEVIARDRGDAYIEGATSGAPQATQVADRWHLLKNLGDALEGFFLHKRVTLREAASGEAERHPDAAALPPAPETETAGTPGPLTPHRPRCGRERQETASSERHERLVHQYEAIHRLHLAGADIADIARMVGVSRTTVYRYRNLPEPPLIRQPRPRRRVIDPYVPYLLQRWNEGCHNGMRLWREIQEQGFNHGSSNVFRFLAELRRDAAAGRPIDTPRRRRTAPVPTARQVAMLLLRRPSGLTSEQQAYLTTLQEQDVAIAAAYRLAQAFATMVRERQGERLDPWREEVAGCDVPALRRFAAGLGRDLDAVRAGLTAAWSNGQTEAHVHRLKLVKRQMYGRAGFTLLRQRMIHVA
jgi:transposase